jgi:hypothetical protein
MSIPMPSPKGTNYERLYVTRSPAGAYDESPETMTDFLRRKGVAEDVIDEFKRRCNVAQDEEEEDSDGDYDALDDAVNKVLAGIAKLSPEDATTCNGALEHILSQVGKGAAADRLPEYKSSGMPKNNIDAGRAMDARLPSIGHIHTGPDGSYDPFLTSRRSTGRAMTMRERDDFAKRFPEAARIKCGDF